MARDSTLAHSMRTISLRFLLDVGAMILDDGRLRLRAAYWPPNRLLVDANQARLPKGGPRNGITTSARRFKVDFCDRLGHEHPDDDVEMCAQVVHCLRHLADAGYTFTPKEDAA